MIQNAAFDRPYDVTRDESLLHLVNEVMVQVDFAETDFRQDHQVCTQYGFVLNPIALCCPEFIGGPAAAPSASGPPTLGEQFFPILETHQIVPVEEDETIIFEHIPHEIAHTIPIDDLAAISIAPDAGVPAPESDRTPTIEEVMPDPLEGFDQVDVRHTDPLRGETAAVTSTADDGSGPRVQAVFDGGGSGTPNSMQATAEMLRLRSQIEHPVTIWTTPKWLKVRLNEVVRVQHLLGTTDFRVTEIEWQADWVLRLSGLLWDALLAEPLQSATVPSVQELTGAGQDSA